MRRITAVRVLLALAAVAILATGTVRLRAQVLATQSAREAIAAAVAERMGAGTTVTVADLDVASGDREYRLATPDPAAQLGRSIWFTLASGQSGAAARTIRARADIRVVAAFARARRPIDRGHILAEDDVLPTRDEVVGLPIRRLPGLPQLIGGRALRAIAAGEVLQSSLVALKRAVQPGDAVTVVAMVGSVQVSASLFAADGGDVGDVVRVVNRETHRYLRGRVVGVGMVEVLHGG